MVQYLSLDGVDDLVRSANVTFDEVEMDFILREKVNTTTTKWYFDARGSTTGSYFYFYQLKDEWQAGSRTKNVYINGVEKTANNYTNLVSAGVRTVARLVFYATTTKQVPFGGSGSTGNFTPLDIYSIKLKNTGVLVAHYDMTTGTVQDQSGNGNHATLTGGTWLDDGTGGGTTPTVHEGESILSSVSNLTAESNLIYNGESTLSAVSNLTSEATVIQSTEVILSAVSNLTAEGDKLSPEISVDLSASSSLSALGSIIVNGETVLSANSDLTAIGEIVSMDISVDLSARALLTVEGSVIQSSEASFSVVIQLEALASLIVSGEVELSTTSQLTVLPEKDIVGVIRLKAKRDLYIYLEAKRELEIRLKGGIQMTATNQGFTRHAGDTMTIILDAGEDLTGCTAKWALKQRVISPEHLIYKDTTNGITINGSEIHIKLDPVDTANLKGDYYHECEITDPSGNVTTVTAGNASILPSGV